MVAHSPLHSTYAFCNLCRMQSKIACKHHTNTNYIVLTYEI